MNGLLSKINFIAFSARFGGTVLKNNEVQIFSTLGHPLLLWQRKGNVSKWIDNHGSNYNPFIRQQLQGM